MDHFMCGILKLAAIKAAFRARCYDIPSVTWY